MLGAGGELVVGRRVGVEEPLRQPDAARIGAVRPRETVAVRRGRALSSRRRCRRRACSAATERSLVTPRSIISASSPPSRSLVREAVAPLDLAEERLAVVGIPHGARADCQHALGTQLLGLAAIVDEDVAHARDRRREEDAPPVDRLAEPRDRLPTHDLLDLAVFDVGDEQASRVRAEVDGGDAHALTLLWRTRDLRETRGVRRRGGTRAAGASCGAPRGPPAAGRRAARATSRGARLRRRAAPRMRSARSRCSWICADTSAMRVDSARERRARALDPAPHRESTEHGVRDPAHEADEEHSERDPEADHRVLR